MCSAVPTKVLLLGLCGLSITLGSRRIGCAIVEDVSYRAWGTIIVVVALIIGGSVLFLQSSGSPRPTTYADIGTELGDGRVERQDIGFAVTTPPGWTAWQPSPSFQDWWGAGTWVHLWMEPTPVSDEWWMGTCDIGEECAYERMVAAGGEAYCWVVDDTEFAAEAEWSDVRVPAVETATGLADLEGWSVFETALEELPRSTASVVRAVDPNGWPQEIWHLTDGERWYRILCGILDSDVEPAGIAESFEILPLPAANHGSAVG